MMKHCLLLLVTLSLSSPCHAGPLFGEIIDLGTLGGTSSFALDVNNSRQVTGNAQEAFSEPSPRLNTFLWNPPSGPMQNLGVLSGSNNFSRGYAINDSGVVVGESDNNISRAFVASGGTMNGLTRLAGDNDRGVAHGINNDGDIVGISSNGTSSRPTLWTNTGSGYLPSDLGTIAGTLASTGRAWDISDNGVAVGLSTNSLGTSQATMWDSGTITNLTSLGDGSNFSQAYAVNESGVAVGTSYTGQTVGQLIGTTSTTAINRAFVWNSGVISELLPHNLYTPSNNGSDTNYHSVANDINDSGLIVGNSQRISGSPAVATLWINGIPIDLNTFFVGSGWILRSAEGINDRGDIVGYGTIGGQTHAFLITAVPEPSSLALMGCASLLLGTLRFCRYTSRRSTETP